MKQFFVANRRKAKKASFELIVKFTIKKIQFILRAYLEVFIFYFFSVLEYGHFSFRVSLIKNLIYSQMMRNEQKFRFQVYVHLFLAATLILVT